jgi:hypothetical protein
VGGGGEAVGRTLKSEKRTEAPSTEPLSASRHSKSSQRPRSALPHRLMARVMPRAHEVRLAAWLLSGTPDGCGAGVSRRPHEPSHDPLTGLEPELALKNCSTRAPCESATVSSPVRASTDASTAKGEDVSMPEAPRPYSCAVDRPVAEGSNSPLAIGNWRAPRHAHDTHNGQRSALGARCGFDFERALGRYVAPID